MKIIRDLRPKRALGRRLGRGAKSVGVLLEGAVWLLLAAGLEAFGRAPKGEWADMLGVLVVLGSIALATALHGPRVKRAAKRVRLSSKRVFGPWKIRSGADLRGAPALRGRHPLRYLTVVAAGVGAAVGMASLRHLWPTAALSGLRATSGLVYLLVLTGLWTTLLAGNVLAIMAVFGLLEDVLAKRLPKLEARGHAAFTLCAAAYALVVAAILLFPAPVPLVATLVALALHAAVLLPCAWSLRGLWKYEAGERGPAWFRPVVWDLAVATFTVAVLAIVMLVTGGERWTARGDPSTAVTAFLGQLFAYSAACLLVPSLVFVTWHGLLSRIHDPARRLPARVHVADCPAADRARVESALRGAGHEVAFAPRAPGRGDVRVRIVAQADPKGFQWSRSWPLDLEVDHMDDPEVRALLSRRDRVQRRRRLLRGLGQLLKLAAARKFENGSGFLIGPHLWFFSHLMRDEDEDEGSPGIGPRYRCCLPLAARSHLYEVLRALEVDLIFLEDGIGFRRFKRVLASLFEYYDMFGPRRIEEGPHFSGLPGVRVMIHDFDIDEPFKSAVYPEPDYEDLGRARVLHVFRDRGEEDETADAPVDWDTLPAPRLEPLLSR